jgi:catechol 2,3-dioxygenase-like lactoylglutathione lyase family enzyme
MLPAVDVVPVRNQALAVTAIDHVVLNVRDVERTVAWYRRVLGMARRDFDPGPGQPSRVALMFGSQKINVRPLSADDRSWSTAENASAGSDDLCFLTDADPEQVLAHLRACGVPIETGPVEREGARGPMQSVYCRDPDGNLIEVASYGTSG